MNLYECLRVELVVAGHLGMGLLMIRVIYTTEETDNEERGKKDEVKMIR